MLSVLVDILTTVERAGTSISVGPPHINGPKIILSTYFHTRLRSFREIWTIQNKSWTTSKMDSSFRKSSPTYIWICFNRAEVRWNNPQNYKTNRLVMISFDLFSVFLFGIIHISSNSAPSRPLRSKDILRIPQLPSSACRSDPMIHMTTKFNAFRDFRISSERFKDWLWLIPCAIYCCC